jgi:hypothetical protein
MQMIGQHNDCIDPKKMSAPDFPKRAEQGVDAFLQ